LDADGEAFVRKTERDGGTGEAGEIQPLRIAHGVQVTRGGAVVSGAMEESGAGGDWGEKDGDLLHLAQDFCAQEVALGAGLDEAIERDGAAGCGVGKIFAQHGADLIFLAGDGFAEEMANHGAEEEPPEFESAIEAVEAKRFETETLVDEQFCGVLDRCARFRGCGAECRAFENSDAEAARVDFVLRTQRNWGRKSIARIWTGHDFEEQTDVGDGASHGADNADPGKGACARGEMTCGRNAAGSGLESADAAEMRGHSNGAAAVAADSTCGAAGSDGCSFAATRAPGGISCVPRIAGSSLEKVVGFVSHEEFGSVCISEEDSARGFQSRDERGVAFGNVAHA